MLLAQIMTQRKPYEGITSVKIISSVIGGLRPMVPIPSDRGVYIAGTDTLMEECWNDRADRRPSFDDIAKRLDGILRAETAGAE